MTMQCTAYIGQTPASDTQRVEQLKTACDSDLLQRVDDSKRNLRNEAYIQASQKVTSCS